MYVDEARRFVAPPKVLMNGSLRHVRSAKQFMVEVTGQDFMVSMMLIMILVTPRVRGFVNASDINILFYQNSSLLQNRGLPRR